MHYKIYQSLYIYIYILSIDKYSASPYNFRSVEDKGRADAFCDVCVWDLFKLALAISHLRDPSTHSLDVGLNQSLRFLAPFENWHPKLGIN